MKFSVYLYPLIGIIHFCRGQNKGQSDRGLLFNRRPILGGIAGGGGGVFPCGNEYDPVDPDQRSLALLGAAAVGGVLGGVAGYHLGMKNQNPPVINNNIYNQLPSPCYAIPVHVTTGGGGGVVGGGGGIGGGGLVGAILSNHPILSNILQGGILQGGLLPGGGRESTRVINRSQRQFQRQIVRPISRIFK